MEADPIGRVAIIVTPIMPDSTLCGFLTEAFPGSFTCLLIGLDHAFNNGHGATNRSDRYDDGIGPDIKACHGCPMLLGKRQGGVDRHVIVGIIVDVNQDTSKGHGILLPFLFRAACTGRGLAALIQRKQDPIEMALAEVVPYLHNESGERLGADLVSGLNLKA
jgi:hypothetical protein